MAWLRPTAIGSPQVSASGGSTPIAPAALRYGLIGDPGRTRLEAGRDGRTRVLAARAALARPRGAADYGAMDQVSRPMLVALAATIALAAVWLVALRPKPAEIAATPAAPVQAVAKAKDAAGVSDTANAKLQAATGGTPAVVPATTPAARAKATTPAKPAITAANARETAVVRDLRGGKVVVLLFWNAKAADDVATRGAVRDLNRHGGKVAVHVVPISRVGEYESITRGVTINQSPTTLVIDRKRRTRSIIGLTERGELTQAVDDALAGRR